ncbi:MAG: hypothetical protein EA349_02845 [Halomonadaceae bacterium]|nr:MAG: hypothetical protein EA349_02845 [Halomonadaceae bacterium]
MPESITAFSEMLSTAYMIFIVYWILGCFGFFVGWFLLRGIGQRLRAANSAFDDFVQTYFLGRGFFFKVQSFALIPAIASGVIHRSFWGRAFRNLEPVEAEKIAATYSMTAREQIFSRFMLFHSWVIVLGLVIGSVVEIMPLILKQLS